MHTLELHQNPTVGHDEMTLAELRALIRNKKLPHLRRLDVTTVTATSAQSKSLREHPSTFVHIRNV